MNSNNRLNGSHVILPGEHEAREFLANGDLIGAIKTLRAANVANGMDLRAAKETVEQWRAEVRIPPTRPSRTTDEISAVGRIYKALLTQPDENRARILSAAATLAGVTH